MKLRTTLIAAGFALAASPAFAFHCPADMAKIDEALAAGVDISDDEMAEVERLRAEGEEFHAAGDHNASVEVLAQAMEILGIE